MDELDALYDAAIAGDADAIAELEMEANRVDGKECTILHNESGKGNTERVRFILREFARKNLLVKLGNQQETALTWAAYFGHTEVVEVLIDAARHLPPSANDNPITSFQAFLRHADQDMDTALHVAVREGNVAIVKLLVEADSTDRHIQNKKGKTPMFIAVENEFNEIVEIISTTCTAPSLDGPDCSIAMRIKNPDQDESPGGTLYKIMDRDALYDAAIAGDADAIAKLEMEADILNEDEETILHIESQNGNTERVRFILREFANKNLLAKQSRYKHTALHLAIYDGHTEVAEVLIDAARHLPSPSSAGDNPITSFQAFLRHGDRDMDTALHGAVMKGHVAIVELLLEADPTHRHIPNKKGKTPMYIAVEQGFNDIVKLLLEADPTHRHIPNKKGKTPMYIAVKKGFNDIVKLICTTCTALSDLDGPGGSTALHAAVKNRNHDIEVVEVLIATARLLSSSSSSDDNDTDVNGNPVISSFQAFLRRGDEHLNTALHIAIMQGNLATAKLLVEADPSDPLIPNKKGKTPLYTAVERGDIDIVKMICTTCTAPFSLKGPGGNMTVLHAVIKNLDEAKKEVRDVFELIIDAIKRVIISKDLNDFLLIHYFLKLYNQSNFTIIDAIELVMHKDVDEYRIHKAFADGLFRQTDEYGQRWPWSKITWKWLN